MTAAIGVALFCVSLAGPAVGGGLDEAWGDIGYLDFRKPVAAFEKAREKAAPGTPEWIEATIGLAVSLHQRQPAAKADKERAAALYDDVVAAAAGRPVQALALLLRARLADRPDFVGDTPDPPLARTLYGRILTDWPDSPLAHHAAIYRSQLDIFTMDPERARRGVKEMREWIAAHPKNPLASLQWLLIGYAYMHPLNDPAQTVRAYEQAEAAGLPAHTNLGVFYLQAAVLAEKAGDKATAIVYYRRLIEKAALSGFAYQAQLRLRALGEKPPPLTDPYALPVRGAGKD